LVHGALEKFWKIAQTQQQLLSYTSEELDQLINKIAFQTVKIFIQSTPQKADKLSPFFQKLEIKRLEQLLKKWLTIEKERPSFSIIALEESNTIKLSDLELKIRVDRIDQLANGDKMVIDYKTGLLPPLSSEDERPEHPQLLLYALADPEVKAWVFAQVKAADPLFKGKSADETNISGIRTIDWETERQQWEQTLLALAEEFLQGEHKALPKKETVCNTCDLHGLCRIRSL
jgi:RecB family exonuclease